MVWCTVENSIPFTQGETEIERTPACYERELAAARESIGAMPADWREDSTAKELTEARERAARLEEVLRGFLLWRQAACMAGGPADVAIELLILDGHMEAAREALAAGGG